MRTDVFYSFVKKTYQGYDQCLLLVIKPNNINEHLWWIIALLSKSRSASHIFYFVLWMLGEFLFCQRDFLWDIFILFIKTLSLVCIQTLTKLVWLHSWSVLNDNSVNNSPSYFFSITLFSQTFTGVHQRVIGREPTCMLCCLCEGWLTESQWPVTDRP